MLGSKMLRADPLGVLAAIAATVALVGVAMFARETSVYAATITVTTTNDELNTDGDCSLREAIEAANSDSAVDACAAGNGTDTIILPAGTYTNSIPNAGGIGEESNATGDLDVTSFVIIEGAGTDATIIDGGGIDRVLDVRFGSTVSLSISDVTIRGGGNVPAPSVGGGIRLMLGSLTVTDSVVTGNNAANLGGGIYNQSGTLTVIRSTISNNVAGDSGGGIFVGAFDPNLTITNSTISGNTGTSNGGGGIQFTITSNEGTLLITNSTITGNTNEGIRDINSAQPSFKNTIVANQASGVDCGGFMTSLGNNLDSDNSCDFLEATDVPGVDPLLGPLQDNGGPTFTHALLDGSPAIDAGDGTACPATDQRGVSRPQGAQCDIGAYERAPAATPTPTDTPTPPPSATPTDTATATPSPTATPTVETVLLAPTGLTAQALDSGRIALLWTDNSSGESGYEVQRDDGLGFVTVATLPPDSASHIDLGLQPDTLYVYRVRAVAGALFSDWSEIAFATTLPDVVPPPTISLPWIAVNTTGDTGARDGVMSLREAMLIANGTLAIASLDAGECAQLLNTAYNGACSEVQSFPGWSIVFEPAVFPPASPASILLGSQLPELRAGVNGSLGAYVSGVIVDGQTKAFDCFSTTSDGNVIRGIRITGCDRAVFISDGADNVIGGAGASDRNIISGNNVGIQIEGPGATGNRILGNYIGTDATGILAAPNETGVAIISTHSNEVGGGEVGEGNLISGNTGDGIHIKFGISNTVEGNLIGTDVSASVAVGNGQGVRIERGITNTIGSVQPLGRNIISGNDGAGVIVDGTGGVASGNVIQGNLIGTDVSGAAALGNGAQGISIDEASDNVVGGDVFGTGNVISANDDEGVRVDDSDDNRIQGNFIGVSIAGEIPLGNGRAGIAISGGRRHLVGGVLPSAQNVISANGSGVTLSGVQHVLQGNYIGTDATGLNALPNNGSGISMSGTGHTIGGDAPGAGNLISANRLRGISYSADGSTIAGNLIGTDATGDAPLGNGSGGIATVADGGLIRANSIAFNVGDGILLDPGASELAIRANTIHSNEGLGIDLGGDGVTLNDGDDSDLGANTAQNFPTLDTAITADLAGPLALHGVLRTSPDTNMVVDFFANDSCDSSGFGEGQRFLDSVFLVTDDDGEATFTQFLSQPVGAGEFITATATTFADSNTSEFSECIEVVAPAIPQDELGVRCLHSPIWPQPGETVTITAEALNADLNPQLLASNVEIWVDDQTAPQVSGPSNEGTSTYSFEPAASGFVDYGCRVQVGSSTAFSGWRKMTVGAGEPSASLFAAVPVLYNAPVAEAIDIVFIADHDYYSGRNDPGFRAGIEDAIKNGYFGEKIFLDNQQRWNFWIALNTGSGSKYDPDASEDGAAEGTCDDGIDNGSSGAADDLDGDCRINCTSGIEAPADWNTKTAFADAGAILHPNSFRDCASSSLRLFSAWASAGDFTRVLRHESGHQPFGLADEYCCDGGYFQPNPFPNLYSSQANCQNDAANVGASPSDCRQPSDPNPTPTPPTTVNWWTSDPADDHLMNDNGQPRPLDIRRILWMFQNCSDGKC